MIWSAEAGHITSNFLQAIFHRFYLAHSWILCPIYSRILVFQEVQKRFPDGLPLLDPIEDMNIKDDNLKKLVRKIESLENRLYSHPLHKDKELETVYNLCQKKCNIEQEIKEHKKELKKAKTILQMDELKCRKRVLRR